MSKTNLLFKKFTNFTNLQIYTKRLVRLDSKFSNSLGIFSSVFVMKYYLAPDSALHSTPCLKT